MKQYKFSIIISNFNGDKYLVDCLSSLFSTDYQNFEVIIIDDGSFDRSLDIISKYKQKNEFKFIQNKKNQGLVVNRNKAINIARGDILVFLDNDTRVDKNWLKELSKTFVEDASIGAAQCKMFDFYKRNKIQQAGMKLIPFTGFGVTLGRGQKDRGQFDTQSGIISLGAALAVRREVAKKINGFDDKLFHYTDDLDFSWRVWIAGYRIVLSPKAVVFHHLKVHTPTFRLYYHLSKNSFRMIIKNYQLVNLLIYFPSSVFINIIGGLSVLFKTKKMDGIFGVTLGIFWSVYNFRDTLDSRSKVQCIRKVSDRDIFNQIMVPANFFEIYKNYIMNARTTINLMK